MTREEALEYLNLPKKSSAQLVKKRYQELQEDYQKAIINAPSQHFRDLYSENLDKIEEAYLLMKREVEGKQNTAAAATAIARPAAASDSVSAAPVVAPPDVSSENIKPSPEENAIHQKLWEVKTVIDTFSTHNELTGKKLNAASRTEIERYISQIEAWQQSLRSEEEPTPIVTPSPTLPQAAAVGASIAPDAISPGAPVVKPKVTQPVETSSTVESSQGINTEPVPEGMGRNEVMEIATKHVENVALESNSQSKEASSNTENNLTAQNEPIIESPKEQSRVEQVKFKRDQLVDQIFRNQSSADRSSSFNRLVSVAILTVFLTGLGGIVYMIYPVLMEEPATQRTAAVEQTVDEPTTNVTSISVAQIVGDEFFRTGNYLEAIVQYTLAFADDPENQYLKHRIDSCKVLLSQSSVVSIPEAGPLTTKTEAQQSQPPERNKPTTPVNSSNRFRGDENVASKEFAWSDWAQDQELNEQVINSARSALLNTNSSGAEIAKLDSPKTSGTNTESILDNPDAIWSFVDSKPEPKGGWEDFKKFTSRKIRFPQEAYRNKISGIVLVQFVVQKDGSITDARVVQGIGYGCDQEALRIINAYKGWTPGILDGHYVNTRAVIPIHFKLAN